MIAPRWHRDTELENPQLMQMPQIRRVAAKPAALTATLPTAPAAPQYFLEVSLKLSLDSVEEFFRLAKTVLKSVQGTNTLKLEAAGQSATRTELLHIWSLPSPNALKDGMVRLADNPAYGQLDRLVVDERQEITTPFGRRLDVLPRPGKGEAYVRVSGHVPSRDLAEYQALHEVVPPRLPTSHWRLWASFLNITGRLNRVTSIWIVPRPGDITTGLELRALPGVELLTDVSVERWSPTAYNP